MWKINVPYFVKDKILLKVTGHRQHGVRPKGRLNVLLLAKGLQACGSTSSGRCDDSLVTLEMRKASDVGSGFSSFSPWVVLREEHLEVQH